MTSQSKFYSKYYTYIQPLARHPVIKTYSSTIFSLIVITFFIFYAIKPTIETILILQKKLVDSTAVLEQVNLKAKNLSQGKANLENMNPTIKSKIDKFIPNSVNLKSIIQTLEQSAQLHQASVSALQIQPITLDTEGEVAIGSIANIDFILNIQGQYQNLVSVLQDLKSSDRLISIDRISFSSREESGLIMSISGKAYYIK